jgi:hypothetical protein
MAKRARDNEDALPSRWKRRRPANTTSGTPYIGTCDTHGKRMYTDRKSARRAANGVHDEPLQAYRCDAIDGMWHVGHPPKAVKEGRITNAEHRSRKGGGGQ